MRFRFVNHFDTPVISLVQPLGIWDYGGTKRGRLAQPFISSVPITSPAAQAVGHARSRFSGRDDTLKGKEQINNVGIFIPVTTAAGLSY